MLVEHHAELIGGLGFRLELVHHVVFRGCQVLGLDSQGLPDDGPMTISADHEAR